MFGEPEKVYLKPQTAVEFGILKKIPKGTYETCTFLPLSITETPTEVSIMGKVDDVETTLTYKKEELTKKQKVFVAWVYLLTEKYETRKVTKKLASEYIKEALKDETDFTKYSGEERWYFPYYLIARHELEVTGVHNPKNELYRFLDEPKEYFAEFYKEILRQEKNEIRKVAVAKIAEKFHPTEGWFINQICEDLYDQQKYDECITYLLGVRERLGEEEWSKKEARVTLWKCYIKRKDYENALSVIQGSIPYEYFQDDFGPLLRGITLTMQGVNYEDAIRNLEEVVIRDYVDSYLTYLASFYLIKCFLETKNTTRLKQVVSTLRVQEDTFLNAGAPLYYGDEVIAILEEVIKSDNLDSQSRAKLKAVLACFLEQFKINPLAKDEKDTKVAERASALAKEALDYFADDTSLNALYSNILSRLGKHDEAMDYKIKSLVKEGAVDAIYPNADLANCSSEYRLKYPKHIAELFEEMDANPSVYIENYGFDTDVGVYWKKKMYNQIAELFLYVKPHISDYEKIGEISNHTGGGLFEIAYSLGEAGDHKEAKFVYEKILEVQGDSLAVLNNLAIEYEKLGDIKKAKEVITKAYQSKGDDEFVERNYARLCGNKKPSSTQKPKTEKVEPIKTPSITFDEKSGNIIFGTKKCEVPVGSNQYQLCKALFSRPLGEWLNETDVVSNFYKEGPRSFYDAVRFVNKRAEQVFKIKKLLAYKASRVQIRTDGVM